MVVIAALCAAMLLVEVIVAEVVGYPRRPRNRMVMVNRESGELGLLRWEQPYTKFWNVEGGNIVVQFNNVGLPGCDVIHGGEERYIFVLGSSLAEGLQCERQFIGTSVLQSNLRDIYPEYQALNLSISGADPYASWFRTRFFETQFEPSSVILVVDPFYKLWPPRHFRPLDFSLSPSFGGEIVFSPARRLFRWLREKSAFVNIFSEAFREDVAEPNAQADVSNSTQMGDSSKQDTKIVLPDLEACLAAFNQRYGSRFVVVLALDSLSEEGMLIDCCHRLGVAHLVASGVLRSENRLHGTGHLNVEGNRKLGDALYNAFLLVQGRNHTKTQ
jgi:hypothetical protein